MRKKLSLQ